MFRAVEIIDTELGIPMAGTMRRWKREAPDGFSFSLLAPPVFGESGFAKTKENRQKLDELAAFAAELGTDAVVFRAPDTLTPTKARAKALHAFLGALPGGFPRPVLDLPTWTAAQAEDAAKGRAVAARDPWADGAPSGPTPFVYFRMLGPAGKRSRYDPEAIEGAAEIIRACKGEQINCIFANTDMDTNGTALLNLLSAP